MINDLSKKYIIVDGVLKQYLGKEKTVYIPKQVKAIDCDAFINSRSFLREVVLPYGLECINSFAFHGCKHLEEVTIPDTVTFIGAYAFKNCKSLASVVLPHSLCDISDGLFSGCESLTDIVIPDTVENIGSYAFAHTGLCYFRTPDNISVIKEGTFLSCNKLRNIHLPLSLSHIKDEAFFECSELKSIYLPSGLKAIGKKAFLGCGFLSEQYNSCVVIPKSVLFIGYKAFHDTYCSFLIER